MTQANLPTNPLTNAPYLNKPINRSSATTRAIPVYRLPVPTRTESYPYLVDDFFYTRRLAHESELRRTRCGYRGGCPTGRVAGRQWRRRDRRPGLHGLVQDARVLRGAQPGLGAIGDGAGGVNYDWFRQDLKPGLLNLNLIIDEEVFLGLMGNAGQVNAIQNSGVNSMPGAQRPADAKPERAGDTIPETGENDNNTFNLGFPACTTSACPRWSR